MARAMRYRLLGRSGLKVSELALGTMTFGESWGWGADEATSKQVFDAFVERGGNFIDTANVYTKGESERFVGKFVAEDRDRFVVGSKYTLSTDPDDPNASGNSRKNMMRAVRESLERLGTDHLDILWVHAWDHLTPVEEVMRGLDDLVRDGLVHYLGVSDTPAWIVAEANTLAREKGWTPFVAYQGQWSVASRGIERDVVPMARHHGLALTPWGCLGGGVLTGKYGSRRKEHETRRRDVSGMPASEQDVTIGEAVVELADELQATPAQVALSWVRAKGEDVMPIVGARNLEQFEDQAGCLDFALKPEESAFLDEASRLDLGFPHDFLLRDNIRKSVYGRDPSKIVTPR